MKCANCGNELPEGAEFCPECGGRVERETPARPEAAGASGPSPAGEDADGVDADDAPEAPSGQGPDETVLSAGGATTVIPSADETLLAEPAATDRTEDAAGDGLDVPADDVAAPAPGKFCVHCGARIPADSAFCPSCGLPADAPGDVTAPGAIPSDQLGAAEAPAPAPRRRHTGAIVACVVAALLVLSCAGVAAAHYLGLMGDPEFLRFLPMREQPADEPSGDEGAGAEPDENRDEDESDEDDEPRVETVELEDLTGLPVETARSRLASDGLSVGEITHEHSDDVPDGRVISQSVDPGEVPEDTVVDLVVSDGPDETEPERSTYTVVTEAMTWEEAEEYCEAHGGHLVTISDAEEWGEVLAIMQSSGREIFWLGARRDGSGDFAWVDGTPFSYASFAAGEPNDDGGVEDYLAVYEVDGSWGWYDAPNDLSPYYKEDRMAFVMEHDG